MCLVSLIAIELKGLAAPGEALKNLFKSKISCQCRRQPCQSCGPLASTMSVISVNPVSHVLEFGGKLPFNGQ